MTEATSQQLDLSLPAPEQSRKGRQVMEQEGASVYFLVKCECDCISLFWKDLVMYVICITSLKKKSYYLG